MCACFCSGHLRNMKGDTPKGEFFGVFRVSPSGQTEQWNWTIHPESIHGWMAVEVGDVPF